MALAEIVESSPVPVIQGVARWQLIDLARWLHDLADMPKRRSPRTPQLMLPRTIPQTLASPIAEYAPIGGAQGRGKITTTLNLPSSHKFMQMHAWGLATNIHCRSYVHLQAEFALLDIRAAGIHKSV